MFLAHGQFLCGSFFFHQKIVVVAWINFLKLISLIQIIFFVLLIKNSDFKKFKEKFAI